MQDRETIRAIINDNTVEITRQIAGITLSKLKPVELIEPCTVHLSVKGTYELDLFLYADKPTLEQIASNMKRSPATNEEVRMYTSEFFNILGGRIVSRINRLFQQSARFSPPAFHCQEIPRSWDEDAMTLFYQSLDGNVVVEGQFHKMNDFQMIG